MFGNTRFYRIPWIACIVAMLWPGSVATADLQLPEDRPLPRYQADLLELAMSAASAMPRDPHLKDRSRAQHEVFQAWLKLDQPRQARAAARAILNWRRGAAAAELAHYLARQGELTSIEPLLKMAEAQALLADQAWRQEYIALHIAKTRLALGETSAAEEFQSKLQTDVYQGTILADLATKDSDQHYERLVERLDRIIGKDRYEGILNAARSYVELYKLHYENEQRRGAIEAKLRRAYKLMGGPETIQLFVMLADAAAANGDKQTALRFADEAGRILADSTWSKYREYEFEYVSLVAGVLYRAGDVEAGRKLLDESASKVDQRMESIGSMRRADCLRPLAEGYQVIGEKERAAELYRRAVTEGAVNVNGRPRAIDLTQTALSMALHEFEPDPSLWNLLREVRAELRAPW